MGLKWVQIIHPAGGAQKSRADTLTCKGKGLKYTSCSVGALCITSNNVTMEQTLNRAYITLLLCDLVLFMIYLARL
jgi:hypothetical protein